MMRMVAWFLIAVGGPIIRVEHWAIGLFGYTYDPVTGVIVEKRSLHASEPSGATQRTSR